VFGDAGDAGVFFDEVPSRLTTERGAAVGEEDFAARAEGRAGFGQIACEAGEGGFADGDDAFFVALAGDAEEAGFAVDGVEGELGDFRDAEAAGVHEFEDGFVAEPEFGAGVGRGEQRFHLGIVEGVGDGFPELGGINRLGGVGGDEFFAGEVLAEDPDRRELPGKAAGAETAFPFREQIIRDVVALDFGEMLEGPGLEKIGEPVEIETVRSAGVGGQSALNGKMIEKRIGQVFHA